MAFIELNFRSSELKRNASVNILLPDKSQEGTPVKTLYLLHGLHGDHTSWMRNTNIEVYARKYNIAVVMPAVERSWYTDTLWGENCFTYVTKELPEACSKYFGLSKEREYNYIAGLSMGGYGAVKASVLCPEKYAGCVSLSGSLDITRKNRECDFTLWKAIFDHNMKSPLELEGTEHDLFHMTKKAISEGKTLPEMFIWCGTEDSLVIPNRDYSMLLCELGVQHTYRESEGDHSWKWWDKHICDGLEFLFADGTQQ